MFWDDGLDGLLLLDGLCLLAVLLDGLNGCLGWMP